MTRVAGGQESERHRAGFNVGSLIASVADRVDLRRAVDDRPKHLVRHRACPPVLPRQCKGRAIFRLVVQLDIERAAVLGRNGGRANTVTPSSSRIGRAKADGRNATRR
jgi:hypothetical protein